jgi:hypothetical protein
MGTVVSVSAEEHHHEEQNKEQELIRQGLLHGTPLWSKRFIGTKRYASLAAHNGIAQSYKDDLESCLHSLMLLLHGSLPWDRDHEYIVTHNDVRDTKQQLVDQVVSGMCTHGAHSSTINGLCAAIEGDHPATGKMMSDLITHCRCVLIRFDLA